MAEATGDAGRFSIVTVHRNGAETLLRTLDALAGAIDPQRDAVLVVDNGSTDDSLARLRAAHPRVNIIENGCNLGYAGAVNRAVAAARSDYVLVLNNDAVVPPGLLERMAQLFAAHPEAAVIGPLLVARDGAPQRCFGVEPTVSGEAGLRRSERRRPPLPVAEVAPVDWISGACMAVRRAAIDRDGSIDDGFFFYFEDVEWCVRLRRAGWRVLLDQNSRVVHEMGTSTKGVRRGAQIEQLRSRLRLYRRIFPPGTAVALGAWRIVRLAVNTAVWGVLAIATLGLVRSVRERFLTYASQALWCLALMPNSWGLPDKCPAGRGRPARR
ncbi:MAG: glycosyltransferase family 2 protein [Rhodospirillales bacterium]|nr:MAG: glycosyltransferase family 2 protein [Rhodospirillales bacterium]